MGFTLPPRMNNTAAADNVRSLMARKDAIEAEMEVQLEILESNSVTMDTPLVDPEGFPRADVDIWAVRHARVRIIELRNDLKALMDKIMLALQTVYNPNAQSQPPTAEPTSGRESDTTTQPFARVDGVAPGSPAATAGLLREDLVISFGPLTKASFATSSLQPLAELVAARENQEVIIEVLRSEDRRVRLAFVPRRGWGGRGLLGCHLVPHPA